MLVVVTVVVNPPGQRSKLDAARVRGARGVRHQCLGVSTNEFREFRGNGDVVHQSPFFGALTLHAVRVGAEHVGKIATYFALVHHPSEAAGSRQHAQQRNFGQADGAGTVVHQQDLVAGQGKLIAAAGAGAVNRSQKLQAVVTAGVLHSIARFVGELAEVDLPGMGRRAQHVDVGSGAEHAITSAGKHDARYLGMLEANALKNVVQLDVNSQVVGVELELVAGL